MIINVHCVQQTPSHLPRILFCDIIPCGILHPGVTSCIDEDLNMYYINVLINAGHRQNPNSPSITRSQTTHRSPCGLSEQHRENSLSDNRVVTCSSKCFDKPPELDRTTLPVLLYSDVFFYIYIYDFVLVVALYLIFCLLIQCTEWFIMLFTYISI